MVGRRSVLAVGLLAAVSGCTTKTGFGGAPDAATASSGARAGMGEPSRIVRDGIFDISRSNEGRFRVRIDGVLRDASRTVLRVTVTSLADTEQPGIDQWGDSSSDYSFAGFKLLDSVGGKLYYAYRLDNQNGLGFGSRLVETKLQPGVNYAAVVYFPPLPSTVTAVTVLSPGTTGEFTGVPVTAGSYTATPLVAAGAARSQQIQAINSPRPPGATVEVPAVEPPADAFSLIADVSGLVAGPERETVSSPAATAVALRSDVLFAFGKATLTAKAGTLIAQAAREITEGGDPTHPINVVGHTDAIGTPVDNQKLSERRARAVEAQLRAALGTGWQFTVSGKGETQPVADNRKPDGSDNPAGRTRNRRVEISYARKPASATASPGSTATATQAAGGAGAPAAFHAGDGTVVAERDGTSDSWTDSVGPVKFHLRVYPFYRDGGYLVAVFDLANVSGTKLDPGLNYFRAPDYPGPAYASFSVIDPAAGTAYRTAFVTIGNLNSYLNGQLHDWHTDQPQRAYMYLPAPPAGVKAVTFDAGPFGKVDNVPVV